MSSMKPTPTLSTNSPTVETSALPLDYRRRRLRSTIGAFLLMVGTSGATGMSFIILPGSADFGVPISTFLVYFSLFTLAAALSMWASGRLAPRFGVKMVIIVAGAVTSASMVGMALSPSLGFLYFFAVLAGLGWGGCTIMSAAVVVNGWHTHNRRGTVLGIVMAGTGPGGMAWGFIMPPLIEATSWRGAMAGVAIACFLLMVLNAMFLISNPPKSIEPKASTEHSLGKATGIKTGMLAPLLLLIVAAIILALESPLYAVLPSILSTAGIGPVEAGALVSIFAFCLIFSPPILGFINDKAGIYVMLAINGLAYVVGFPALALLSGFVPLAVSVAVLSFAVISTIVVVPLVVTRTVGEEQFPAIYGIVMMVTYFGLAIGAPLWGMSYDLTGKYSAALYIAVVGAVLALVLMAVAMRAGEKQQSCKNENIA